MRVCSREIDAAAHLSPFAGRGRIARLRDPGEGALPRV